VQFVQRLRAHPEQLLDRDRPVREQQRFAEATVVGRHRPRRTTLGELETEPQEGDPLYGLYQHKQSFGGQWLALTGAHERVFDPRGYQIGRLASRAARVIGR